VRRAGGQRGSQPDRQRWGGGGCTEPDRPSAGAVDIDRTVYVLAQRFAAARSRRPDAVHSVSAAYVHPARPDCVVVQQPRALRPWSHRRAPPSDCVCAALLHRPPSLLQRRRTLCQGHTGWLTLSVLDPASLLRCCGNGRLSSWRLTVKKTLWAWLQAQAALLRTQRIKTENSHNSGAWLAAPVHAAEHE